MIELDDSITTLNLGLDDYIILNALEVKTVRNFLLLDIDRVLSLRIYGQDQRERITIWQKLLRKYLTYEKIHNARNEMGYVKDEIIIHDSLSSVVLDPSDEKFLVSIGIETILHFLQADIPVLLSEKECDQDMIDRIASIHDDLSKKKLMEQSLENSVMEEFTGKRQTHAEEPDDTVSVEEFLLAPVASTGLNPNELEILDALNVETVQDFLEFDVKRVDELKGYSDRVQLRLASWQKYMKRKLEPDGSTE